MNSKIDAGELREVIYIQRKESDFDENGFSQDIYKNVHRLRCKVKTLNLKTKESVIANRDSSTVTLKFICRRRKGINNKMFILYEDERYDITNVHKLDDFFIEITAEMYI